MDQTGLAALKPDDRTVVRKFDYRSFDGTPDVNRQYTVKYSSLPPRTSSGVTLGYPTTCTQYIGMKMACQQAFLPVIRRLWFREVGVNLAAFGPLHPWG